MIDYDLNKIRAVIFDVDGVLSTDTITLHPTAGPMRTVNTKDGYAMQLAMKMGLRVAIMTGADTESIRTRYERLGLEDIYMKCAVKLVAYEDFVGRHGLSDEEVMYMGDDIPDYEIMQRCGCAVCPADACPDIRSVSLYVSQVRGGMGCARDVLEQVLRAQGKWLSNEKAFGW